MNTRWRARGRIYDPHDRRSSRGEAQQRAGSVVFWTLTGALSAYIVVHIMWWVVEYSLTRAW